MFRGDRGAERAGRAVTNGAVGIATTSGARGNTAGGVQLDVGGEVTGIIDRGTSGFTGFQGEFIGGGINLAEVVDASIGLGGRTGFHKVRNRDGGQQTDDGHDDHDFNQGETRFTDVLIRFHFVCLCNVA